MSDKFTWMHSGQIGAPQMSGASGSNGQLLQVLDACLVDGFNTKTVTTASKTATSVTLTYGTSHGYEQSQAVIVSGASDALLNGRHKVFSRTDNSITLLIDGVSSTTGSITTKVAPLGFQSIFGSADPLKRAYRSTDATSSKTVLFLDMSYPANAGYHATNPAKRAMVSMCEDMTVLGTQINSYTNTLNDYATNPNGKLFIYQARGYRRTDAVSSTDDRKWVIVGNNRVFYLFNAWLLPQSYSNNLRDTFAFGDFDTLDGEETDINCGWIGTVNVNDDGAIYSVKVGSEMGGSLPNDVKGYMIKSYQGTGGPVPFTLGSDYSSSKTYSGYISSTPTTPDPITSGLTAFPVYVRIDGYLRAALPRLLNINQSLVTLSTWDRVLSDDVVIVATARLGSASNGFFGIDLKG